eukprot:Selendium_serpulae@DN5602_c2_g2_i1.p1
MCSPRPARDGRPAHLGRQGSSKTTTKDTTETLESVGEQSPMNFSQSPEALGRRLAPRPIRQPSDGGDAENDRRRRQPSAATALTNGKIEEWPCAEEALPMAENINLQQQRNAQQNSSSSSQLLLSPSPSPSNGDRRAKPRNATALEILPSLDMPTLHGNEGPKEK